MPGDDSNEGMSIQQMTNHNFKPVRKNSKLPLSQYKLNNSAGVNQYIKHLDKRTQEELDKSTRIAVKKYRNTGAHPSTFQNDYQEIRYKMGAKSTTKSRAAHEMGSTESKDYMVK